jgi:hypothetical protein
MHITENELTAASSAVAALAIVGGHLGVRSANQNALRISREERSSKRQEELNALKRGVYVNALDKLSALADAEAELSGMATDTAASSQLRPDAVRRQIEARQVAFRSVAELTLATPNNLLRDLANKALSAAMDYDVENVRRFNLGMSQLQVMLRYDLEGRELPSAEELNQLSDSSLNKQASDETEIA